MSDNPYESPEAAEESAASHDGVPIGCMVKTFVGIVFVGLLIALLLPAVRTAGPAARRMSCTNQLKQIALALHNYHDAYGCFPPAYTIDEDGNPLHSWRTLILPFIEQQALYETIDLSKAWDDPVNKDARETQIFTYRCPEGTRAATHTSYLAVIAPDSCFQRTESRTLSDITDDPGTTMMVIEVDADHEVPWMAPVDIDEQWVLRINRLEDPPHEGGLNVAFVDGSVHFLSTETDQSHLRALISISGNDHAGDL
jgi:prepilin-type processing-associated H-X9-DG protein